MTWELAEALVLRRRPVAECSSSVVAGELASSLQPLQLLLEVVVRQSAVLRMIRWGCSVVVAVAAAMRPLGRVEPGGVRVSVTSRCPSERSVAAVRSVG